MFKCHVVDNILFFILNKNYESKSKSSMHNLITPEAVFKKKIWRTWVLFRGATDTPVLDFWWHLSWVSKPGWIPFSMLSHLCDLQIHVWCNTCPLYRGQHGSRAFLIHVLTQALVEVRAGAPTQDHLCGEHSTVYHSDTPARLFTLH